MNIFEASKQVSEIIHDEDTDFDAPVKIILPNGTEFLVTDFEYEINKTDNTPAVWLTVVEE